MYSWIVFTLNMLHSSHLVRFYYVFLLLDPCLLEVRSDISRHIVPFFVTLTVWSVSSAEVVVT